MFANAVVDSCSTFIIKKYVQFNVPVEHVYKYINYCAEYS